MRLSFGKLGVPTEPLLVCPACFHVGAGVVLPGDLIECAWCHRVVAVAKLQVNTEKAIAAARAEFGHPANHKEWLQACAVRLPGEE